VIAALACISIGSGCSGDDDGKMSSAVEEDGGASEAGKSGGKTKGGAGASNGDSGSSRAEVAGSRAEPAEAGTGSERGEPEKGRSSSAGATASSAGASGGGSVSGISVNGIVVDSSNGNATKNFDHTKYPALAGVKVCVYDNAGVPCATTDSDGNYTLGGLPEKLDVYLSYEKDSFARMLFKPMPGTGTEMPAMLMVTSEYRDAFAKVGGIEPDAATGFIYFGANLLESRGTMFHQRFGTLEVYYLRAYSLSVAPPAKAGPVYVSSHWAPDATLTVSSAAGWGIVQATPGDYTLSYEHPSLTYPTVTAKVVKGFITTYVSVVCSVGDADAGI
jgi:hypothetical protein